MRCPYCAHLETQVAETRESDEGDVVRRRRKCTGCEKRFTTYERAEIALPALVKRSGARVEFDLSKLRSSMNQVSIEQVDAALERIQETLLSSGHRELPTTRIGELVMRELKRLDKVAYVRFASVYRSFEDVDEFSRLIQEI
jgi:transcriptional repressor NrdR